MRARTTFTSLLRGRCSCVGSIVRRRPSMVAVVASGIFSAGALTGVGRGDGPSVLIGNTNGSAIRSRPKHLAHPRGCGAYPRLSQEGEPSDTAGDEGIGKALDCSKQMRSTSLKPSASAIHCTVRSVGFRLRLSASRNVPESMRARRASSARDMAPRMRSRSMTSPRNAQSILPRLHKRLCSP